MSMVNIIKEEKHDLERKIIELVRKFENLNNLSISKINVKSWSCAERKHVEDVSVTIVI